MTNVDRDFKVHYLCQVNEYSWYIHTYIHTYLLFYYVNIRGAFVRRALSRGTFVRGLLFGGNRQYPIFENLDENGRDMLCNQ